MKTYKLVLLIVLTLSISFTHAHERLNIEYVKNAGQWHQNVLYKVNYGGGAIFLEKGCFTYTFCNPEDRASVHDYSQWSKELQDAFHIRGHSWKMHFDGALNPLVAGEKIQEHYYNYFIGNDKSKWNSRVSIFEAVKYSNLYEGIDLRSYNRGANFKYDFIVNLGADPSAIQLDFEGLDDVKILDGNLVLETSIGEFKENEPFAYQIIDGIMVEVACEYSIQNEIVSFNLPNGYNAEYKLIIDPELIAATLSGTVGADNYGHTATFDLAGEIYTGAISFGAGYPSTTGAFDEDFNGGGGWGTDIAVSHLTADGSDLVWASYLGGGEGDYPHSIICNSQQELYVYGSSSATDFPTTLGAFDETHNGLSDIVISKFSADGTELLGSTFLGGAMDDGRNAYSVNYGDTYRGEIILDQTERPLIASFSQSNNYPVSENPFQSELAGAQDAVVTRLNPLLTNLEMSTYLGSTDNDSGYGLRTTSAGNICIAGMAGADNFPITDGCYQSSFLGGGGGWLGESDGFISILDDSGSELISSTFYGTDQQDQIFFIDLDSDENIFVYGQGGVNIPIVGDVYNNPNSTQFISKFDQSLSTLLLSTQIGSADGDESYDFVPIAFLVDHCNNIYVSSHGANTFGGSLPLTPDALYESGEGSFYLAVLTADLAELEYATFYTSNHVDGGTSRFDKKGIVYQGVCSGGDFATTPDAWAPNQATGWDIGVFKIDFGFSGVVSSMTTSELNGCVPFEVDFSNYSVGEDYLWNFGDGTTSTEDEPSHTYTEPGTYIISLVVTDSLSCNYADTTSIEIQVSIPQVIEPDFTWTIDCETNGVICTNTTDVDYFDYIWDMGDGTLLNTYNASYNYGATGTYEITLQAIDTGCNDTESVSYEIDIDDAIVVSSASVDDLVSCDDPPYDIQFTGSGEEVTHYWSFGDNSTSNEQNPNHTYYDSGEYNVMYVVSDPESCNLADTTYLSLSINQLGDISGEMQLLLPDPCSDSLLIGGIFTGEGVESISWDMGDGEIINNSNSIQHEYFSTGTYTITLTASESVCDHELTISDVITLGLGVGMGEIEIPNVITPNGDQFNEEFRLKYSGNTVGNPLNNLEDYSVKIFNRWGNLIFESGQEKSSWVWDGKINNEVASEGAYYYILSYKEYCTSKEIQDVHGHFSILK